MDDSDGVLSEENISDELEELIEKKIEERIEEKQSSKNNSERNKLSDREDKSNGMTRRSFLKKTGLGALAIGALGITPASSMILRDPDGVDVQDGPLDMNGNDIINVGNLGGGGSGGAEFEITEDLTPYKDGSGNVGTSELGDAAADYRDGNLTKLALLDIAYAFRNAPFGLPDTVTYTIGRSTSTISGTVTEDLTSYKDGSGSVGTSELGDAAADYRDGNLTKAALIDVREAFETSTSLPDSKSYDGSSTYKSLVYTSPITGNVYDASIINEGNSSGGGSGGVTVSDSGSEVLADASGVDFASNLSVSDDGDGTVTVDGNIPSNKGIIDKIGRDAQYIRLIHDSGSIYAAFKDDGDSNNIVCRKYDVDTTDLQWEKELFNAQDTTRVSGIEHHNSSLYISIYDGSEALISLSESDGSQNWSDDLLGNNASDLIKHYDDNNNQYYLYVATGPDVFKIDFDGNYEWTNSQANELTTVGFNPDDHEILGYRERTDTVDINSIKPDGSSSTITSLDISEADHTIRGINDMIDADEGFVVLMQRGSSHMVEQYDYSGSKIRERRVSGTTPVREIIKVNTMALVIGTDYHAVRFMDSGLNNLWVNLEFDHRRISGLAYTGSPTSDRIFVADWSGTIRQLNFSGRPV